MKYQILIATAALFMVCSCGNTISAGGELAEKGFYSLPEETIKSLGEEPKGYAQNYVLAQAYLKQKNYKRAMLHFANSAFKSKRNFKLRLFPHPVYAFVDSFHFKSPYFDDSMYHIARLFYTYREYKYVIKFIDLMDDSPGALYRDASILKAKALDRLKKRKEALATLKELLEEYPDPLSQALVQIRMASLYEKSNKFALAAKSYEKLLDSPEQWHQNLGADHLYSMIKEKKVEMPKSTSVKVAQILVNGGKIKEGETLAMPLLPFIEGEKPDSLQTKLLTLTSPAGAKTFIESRRGKKYYNSLRLIHANTLWSRGRKFNAIAIYQTLTNTQNAKIASRVLTRLSHYYEERNNPLCIKYMTKYTTLFPQNPQTGEFLWLMGRFHIKQGNTARALKYFHTLISSMPENQNSAKALYWKLRLIKKLTPGEKENIRAQMNYHNPSSPYTLRELKKLATKTSKKKILARYKYHKGKGHYKKMLLQASLLFLQEGYAGTLSKMQNDFPEDFISPFTGFSEIIKNQKYESIGKTQLSTLERYFALGNIEAIKRELAMLNQNDEQVKYDIALALARLGAKYRNYHYASLNSLKILKLSQKKEYLPFMEKKYARMLYPLAFKNSVMKESKKYNIDHAVILAMIRAESYYIPHAISPAGARGLMQLMPATAKGIARNLKIKKYNLLNPKTSIKFGTDYISWLNKYYRGQFEYIVAGYNAGAGNVNKWKEKYKGFSKDYLTEFTPFQETRYYIYSTEKFRIQYESIAKNKE